MQPRLLVFTAAALAAAVGAWTFRGALEYGFSQDDYLGLARATGHAERLPFGWRWLSHQLWWDFVAGPLQGRAVAAHAFVLGVHAAAAALLTVLLARRLSLPAALIGAVFVTSHPSSYTAVYWAAASGDTLVALLSLGTLACAFASRGRWLAPVLFALALLCKESALPLPIAWLALAVLWRDPAKVSAQPWRDPVWWNCVALALALVAFWPPSSKLAGEAYRVSLNGVPGNLLSYDGWLANRWYSTVRGFTDGVDPAVFGWAVALNACWLAGAFVPALRRTGWLAGGLAWSLMLAPVLPLVNHTYHYYMVAALPAAGLLVASLATTLFVRLPNAAAWGIALVFAMFLALDGHALVAKIETMPFKVDGLRADATVDRARIAEAAITDLRSAALPPHSRLRLWSPQAQGLSAQEGVAAGHEGYYERNVRTALLDGLALVVQVPELDSASFVRAFDPADSLAWWALYRHDGHLRVVRSGELTRILASAPR